MTRPKTGEPRKSRQPLKIDLLPQVAQDAIRTLYESGLTWQQLEERSAKPYSKEWGKDGGGFIDWESLDLKVLEQFPDMKLPHTTLHRWFDLRVSQARQQVLDQAAKTREFVAAFAGKDVAGANSAVVNALRDMVFGLVETASRGDKARFMEELKDLTLAMTRMQRVELQKQRVDVDVRKVKLLEERECQTRESFDRETKAAANKGSGQFGLDQINLLRERVMGLPPLKVDQ